MGANNKRRTTDEYKKELEMKNPNIEVLDEYINARTKISHRCKTHNVIFDILPESALKGYGCNMCHKERIVLANSKTHEQYVDEVKIINPNIDVLEKYVNARTKILHRCNLHGMEWYAYPYNILNNQGCKLCGNEKISNILSRSHEEYVKEVNGINPNITVLGEYVNSNTKILHKCLIHDIEWYVSPLSILNGGGCQKCGVERSAISRKKSHSKYIKELSEKNPNIEVIGKYKKSLTPILHRCKIDNYEWMARPANILHGNGCPMCSNSVSITHEQYIDRVKEINNNIEVIGEYINASTKVLHKCLICNNEWSTIPSVIYQGCGCPSCSSSKGELQVKSWLDDKGISYEYQKRFDDCKRKNTLPFDFYLPNYNICIEYDGKQHYEPIEYFGGKEGFKLTQSRDQIKTNYCNDNGITLIRIPYYENVKEKLDLLLT